MGSKIPIGSFVSVLGSELGIGKLVDITGSKAKVEWFRSISQRDTQDCDIKLVKRATPSKQTRCYVVGEFESNWRMGRLMNVCSSEGGTGRQLDVHFGGGGAEYIPEERIFVRCLLPSIDPIETLIYHGQETPFFYEKRRWNELQNIDRDIRLLTNYFHRLLKQTTVI